jgi:hypothetical protein
VRAIGGRDATRPVFSPSYEVVEKLWTNNDARNRGVRSGSESNYPPWSLERRLSSAQGRSAAQLTRTRTRNRLSASVPGDAVRLTTHFCLVR